MAAVVASWSASGLSRMTFCKQQNISYTLLGYWCKRLAAAGDPALGKTAFRELSIPSVTHPDLNLQAFAQITFPGGVQIVFSEAVTPAFISDLVRAL